nr:protein tic 56, chloroplastic [Quercus suber]
MVSFLQRLFKIFSDLSNEVYSKLEETIPGFDKVMEKVQADVDARQAKRKERRETQKKAEKMDLYGRRRIP